jgi:glucuronate isomerase
LLQQKEYSTLGLLNKMKVEVVGTTDDPADSLGFHQQFAKQDTLMKMYPTFRPDKAYATENPAAYNRYLEVLGEAAKIQINTYDDLFQALLNRADFFESLGCRASDHGMENLYFDKDAEKAAPRLFSSVRAGKLLDAHENLQIKCAVLIGLAKIYHKKGWVQQFHLGAMRNNNTRLLRELGPDTGFDSMGDFSQGKQMSQFFDHLEKGKQLTKTILYNNNPADNELFSTFIGNFSQEGIPGKMQCGSGWWFLDQKEGMEKQLNALSNMGLLSRFVGMVTDSRSFLSFPRHEYFRRILCNLWGNDMEKGLLPDDLQQVGKVVEDICYHNAKRYFNF